ncbi:hypothetical protein Ddye_011191 [Dipteronia dyeriana]|uniref:Uncharacterized protein n=1 Tax=Dipteronia dyeriana TaxID=168575 RepID=A0AAD9XET4_9ROSI|nr:hypothetical protein Ddye_011191 [Dipteronia dyeriana]
MTATVRGLSRFSFAEAAVVVVVCFVVLTRRHPRHRSSLPSLAIDALNCEKKQKGSESIVQR